MLRTFGMYLKLDGFQSMRTGKELRSGNSIRLVVLRENDIFQDNASKLFNNLPETIRNCKDYRTFLSLSSNFYVTEYRVIG